MVTNSTEALPADDMPSGCTISASLPSEDTALTAIAFAAKRHWNYPEEYVNRWRRELTISGAYIQKNVVFTVRSEKRIVGFYSIAENQADCFAGEVPVEKGWWLDHMFVAPEYHRRGIGRSMIAHVKSVAAERGVGRLLIFVDPHARGFYDKIGAEFLYESKSSIPGRMIPVYVLRMA